MVGTWKKGPGVELFEALEAALGEVPILAEDLGVITPDVVALREVRRWAGMHTTGLQARSRLGTGDEEGSHPLQAGWSLQVLLFASRCLLHCCPNALPIPLQPPPQAIGAPGMVVLQFAWGGGPTNTHLPHNIYENCFVYPGVCAAWLLCAQVARCGGSWMPCWHMARCGWHPADLQQACSDPGANSAEYMCSPGPAPSKESAARPRPAGTHDNQTAVGWWKKGAQVRQRLAPAPALSCPEPVHGASTAQLVCGMAPRQPLPRGTVTKPNCCRLRRRR